MALKKTVTTQHGFDAVAAYHRVEGVSLQGKSAMSFLVKSYREPNGVAFGEQAFECQYDLNGENPIKQAYGHVKSTDAFSGAVDC